MIYGNRFLNYNILNEKESEDISFYYKIDNKSNNYCNNICESLTKKEKEEFGIQGDEKHIDKERFKKIKNKIIHRIVLLFNEKPVCFIEVYKENRMGKNYGEISIVTHSKYRHRGFASIVLEKTIEWYQSTNVDIVSLTWPVDKNNTSSINLAKKFGFKKMNKSNYYFSEEYYNDYPVYEYNK